MECRPIKQVTTPRKAAIPPSRLSPKVKDAIKHGKASVLQEYGGKVLVRYEYRDRDGLIIVLAERFSWLTGKTGKDDFSWHNVLTAYNTMDNLNL